jgi:hypothetical protein
MGTFAFFSIGDFFSTLRMSMGLRNIARRSQLLTRPKTYTDQNRLKHFAKFPLEEFFAPTAPPSAKEKQWIKTIPGKGRFVYFRIYGLEQAAFDGSWKPGDFQEVR